MTSQRQRDLDLLRLRLISEAKERGISWHQIAKGMNFPDAKTAKNTTKKLARRYERLLRREAEQGGDS
jgi:DNA-binding transcriptional MerR regulator